jgi:DNA invertase Pin-like site-specific DNA recombinase
MRQMMGVFGQLERAMIVARLRKGREAKARAGGFAFGAPPFGFSVTDGVLAPHEDEQRTIRLAKRLRQGGASLRQIASALTENGIASKRGGRWHPATVSRLLERAV